MTSLLQSLHTGLQDIRINLLKIKGGFRLPRLNGLNHAKRKLAAASTTAIIISKSSIWAASQICWNSTWAKLVDKSLSLSVVLKSKLCGLKFCSKCFNLILSHHINDTLSICLSSGDNITSVLSILITYSINISVGFAKLLSYKFFILYFYMFPYSSDYIFIFAICQFLASGMQRVRHSWENLLITLLIFLVVEPSKLLQWVSFSLAADWHIYKYVLYMAYYSLKLYIREKYL